MKGKIIVAIVILLLLIASCQVSVKENKAIKAPDFSIQDINGQMVALSDFKGKVVILDFWATWCAPCVKELPTFQKLYDRYRENGFVMIGISVDAQGASLVKPFILKKSITYPNLIATEEIQNLYGEKNPEIKRIYGPIQGIPSTFIINRKGEIVQKYVGEVPERIIENHITKLLQEPAS